MNSINILIGQKVSSVRKSAGKSAKQLAVETELTEFRVMQIEKGNVSATADELYLIAQALNVSPKIFFSEIPTD